jgi:MoaA/NifB/PqqE/SkfB family radical SAM enzyme
MSERVLEDCISFLERSSSEFHTRVALAGGDPTAHLQFFEVVKRISKVSDDVTIVTHGANLSAADLAAIRRNSNVRIQFSIPSLNPERYRLLTGNGQLERVLTSLLMCCELAIPTSLSAVLTSINCGDLEHLAELTAEVRAEYLIANRFLASGRGIYYTKEFSLSESAFSEALVKGKQVADALGVRLLASGADPNVRARKAREPKMTVSTSGDIRLCSLAPNSLATLDSNPRQLVGEITRFWNSSLELNGCYCSNQT